MSYDSAGNLLAVDGPLPWTEDTTRYRYNRARQLVGTISPDPDGSGTLKHRAQRITYGAWGQAIRSERGTVNSQSDADWGAFSPLEAVETGYDADARPVSRALKSGSTTYTLTQTSYDALGRPECTAQRMNPSAFGALPASACSLGTQGTASTGQDFGPDRIVRTVYDAAGQVTQVRTAVGTADEAAEASTSYRLNGGVETLTDAENNKTTYEYDGHDRLARTIFPSPTKGSGTSNPNDYEEQAYDPNGNVTSFRNRAGQTTVFNFDNLNRLVMKDLWGWERDATYKYDLFGRLIEASQNTILSFAYDALGRKVRETGIGGSIRSEYDSAGRRTRITHPDGFYVSQEYLVTGEVSLINGPGHWFYYDNLGRRYWLTRSNGTSTSYGYDPVSRLSHLRHDLAGTTHDITLSFSYNPASQIVSTSRSNDAYAFTGHANGTVSESPNGLNQLADQAGKVITYDAKGNVTYDPATGYTFGYSSENLLTTVNGPSWTGTLRYDPLMRLVAAGTFNSTWVANDGENRIAEYNEAGQRTLLIVHGPGINEPLLTYDKVNGHRSLYADERGSIIAGANSSGNVDQVYGYDEYGTIAAARHNRFEFTGHVYESMSQLLYARGRFYNPKLGRFMQPDPIGYDDGMNMYAYVKGDPVNSADPTGLQEWCGGSCEPIEIVKKLSAPSGSGSGSGGAALLGSRGGGGLLGGGGSGGGDAGCLIRGNCPGMPVPRHVPPKQQPKQQPCSRSLNSSGGSFRAVAGTVADAADAASVAFGVAALVASPTVVGGGTLAVLAGVAKGVSIAASGLEGLVAWGQGDNAAAIGAGVGIAGGLVGPPGSRAFRSAYNVGGRYGRAIDDVAGVAAGKVGSSAACAVARGR